VLDIPAEADPLPVLRDELRRLSPDIVLAGSRAETGEGSGLLPYLLAEELGLPLASGVTALALGCAEAAITVAAPGGRRRRLASSLPVLVAVDDKGPAPRLAAFGAKRRGEIAVTPAEATADARASWSSRPARPRPKRLSGPPAAGAAGAGREVRADLDAAAAAQTILTYLQQEGLAPRAPAPLRKSDTP
jgi:electron transfer flavoprotein beta subunit